MRGFRAALPALLLLLSLAALAHAQCDVRQHLVALRNNVTLNLERLRDETQEQWNEGSHRNIKCQYLDMCNKDMNITTSGLVVESGIDAFVFGPENVTRSSVKARGEIDNPGRFWRDVCVTAELDDEFKENAMVDLVANTTQASYQFIGTQAEGLFRTYPGYFWDDKCSAYDPRFRPWYSTAAAGPKDVVVLLDTSSSMANGNRLVLAQEAAKQLILSLSFYDFANVVWFSSQYEHGTASAFPLLVQMTGANREKLVSRIDRVFADGEADFSKAFTKAFDIFTNSSKNTDTSAAGFPAHTSNCAKVIVFITDGDTTGQDPRTVIRQHEDQDVRIFTYTLGDEAGQRIANQIACENQGIHFHVDGSSGVSLLSLVAELYRYFAARGGYDADKVKLSELYKIAGGNGIPDWYVSTAVLPVFNDTKLPSDLIGVVGEDIPKGSLLDSDNCNFPEANVTVELERLAREQESCPSLDLTPETIESLRSQYGQACDQGLSTLYILLIVGAGMIVLSAAFMLYRVRSARTEASQSDLAEEEVERSTKLVIGPILSNLLSGADYVLHWLWVFELINVQESQLAIISAAFLIAALFINVTLGLTALVSFKANERLRRWILRRPLAVALITLITAVNLDGMTLLSCNLRLPYVKRMDAPLDSALRRKLTRWGIISNLIEDVPLIVIQLLLTSESRQGSSGSLVFSASLVVSIVAISLSAIKRIAWLRLNPLGKAIGDLLDPEYIDIGSAVDPASAALTGAVGMAKPSELVLSDDVTLKLLSRGTGAEVLLGPNALARMHSNGSYVVTIPPEALVATRVSTGSRVRGNSSSRRASRFRRSDGSQGSRRGNASLKA